MRISPKVWLLFLPLFHLSCVSAEQKSSDEKINKPLVQPQYKLQEDRKAFDEVRSQIPEDKKAINDELAYMEKLFENPLEQPSKIRDRFQKLLMKKRESFAKDMTKKREAFVKQERKDRDQFTKEAEAKRNEFKKRKTTNDERKEFYADIDQKRKDFYANQREKRDEFEAQIRDDRKNFEDYVKEKSNDFNSRHKEFSAKQRDILKEKKDGKPAGQ